MGGGEFLPRHSGGEHQKVQVAAGLLGENALTWWAEYIKDHEIVKSEMTWTEFKTLVMSRFTPEYTNMCRITINN